jgi:hypothetical protein
MPALGQLDSSPHRPRNALEEGQAGAHHVGGILGWQQAGIDDHLGRVGRLAGGAGARQGGDLPGIRAAVQLLGVARGR